MEGSYVFKVSKFKIQTIIFDPTTIDHEHDPIMVMEYIGHQNSAHREAIQA